MKVLVCGGRDFNDAALMNFWLATFHRRTPITMLIHGGAKGADKMAGRWAQASGIHAAEVMALWDALGRAAGPMRNEAMLLLQPDHVVAFPGGRGTAHMVGLSLAADIPVTTVRGYE